MKHAKLGTLDVGRIGLGAMGMSAAYTGAGSDDAIEAARAGSVTTPWPGNASRRTPSRSASRCRRRGFRMVVGGSSHRDAQFKSRDPDRSHVRQHWFSRNSFEGLEQQVSADESYWFSNPVLKSTPGSFIRPWSLFLPLPAVRDRPGRFAAAACATGS
jgi:hypothetical protein